MLATTSEPESPTDHHSTTGADEAAIKAFEADILEANATAMHLSQSLSFNEAAERLEIVLMRLQHDSTINDRLVIDRLKATTLNNLGVVECRKGSHERSLDHLDGALSIEERLGIQSPSTALNLCAALNALGEYEKATQHALAAINYLSNTDDGVPSRENQVLWGAAWHNLGVAQLNNTNSSAGAAERAGVVLNIFRNAMRSTIDLLGPKHPMTVAVHDTFRAVRATLKQKGAFAIRDQMPAPTVGPTGAPAATTTLPRIGTAQGGNKPNDGNNQNQQQQRLMSPPKTARRPVPVGLDGKPLLTSEEQMLATMPPYTPRQQQSQQRPRTKPAQQDLFHPTQTLQGAGRLYQCRQPVHQAIGQNVHITTNGNGQPGGTLPVLPPHARKRMPYRRMSNDAKWVESPVKYHRHLKGQQELPPPQPPQIEARSGTRGRGGDGGGKGRSHNGRPPVHDLGDPSWHAVPAQYGNQQQQGQHQHGKERRLSELLMGDMWIELELPRHSPPVSNFDAKVTGGNNRNGNANNNDATDKQQQQQQQQQGIRPAYSEPLYVIDPSDPVLENVAQPAAHATLDMNTQYQFAPRPPQQQADPRQPQQSVSTPLANLTQALGPDMSRYPNLQQFVQANPDRIML